MFLRDSLMVNGGMASRGFSNDFLLLFTLLGDPFSVVVSLLLAPVDRRCTKLLLLSLRERYVLLKRLKL